MELEVYLNHIRKTVEKRIAEHIVIQQSPQKKLFEAALYSLNSPGKRLRPILTILAAEMFGVDISISLDPAIAIEMIHTYSLIHDDLPCMDDDDLRRGLPTLHKAYDEAHATLTGDFLLTYAFEILSQSKTSDYQKVKLIEMIAKRAGGNGMIAGQVADLAFEGKTISKKELFFMHSHKTAHLISACFECAALLGDATQEERENLFILGQNVGLAYQIIDDILDETSSTASLGKTVGSDRSHQKASSIVVLGLEKAKSYAKILQLKALQNLDSLKRESPRLKAFISKLISRKY